ncbi:peptide chain release factor 1, mitochondrial [Lethenteron reissneri]|uniref:peptide chain release factor 1, mitochondrial n=1 Tax=Lethenteron reissneri TaxID=7753 RepID=UPI002AB68875|nr:peptide chain release factor 1, mitochondrial [Lethenteron reissneri]
MPGASVRLSSRLLLRPNWSSLAPWSTKCPRLHFGLRTQPWRPLVTLDTSTVRNSSCVGLKMQTNSTGCSFTDGHLSWAIVRRYCTSRRDSLRLYLQGLQAEHVAVIEALRRLGEGTGTGGDPRTLRRRQQELAPLVAMIGCLENKQHELREVEDLLASVEAEKDRHMQALAVEEKERIQGEAGNLERKVLDLLLPKDPHDDRDVILEVTAGRTTGGDICQRFAAELFDMYQGFAKHRNWNFEIMSFALADCGGLHHASARITGDAVFRHLKFEGGTHRVQRIPQTGLSSRMERIHTGTTTVIVLPQPRDIDIKLETKDLRIDTFRAKGAGGQHVNTTDSAVRVVHLPTGLTAECQQERSQIRNKEMALQILKTKMYQQLFELEVQERHSARRLQVGTRSQSERIRTYTLTQDRVTDHRISLTLHDVQTVLEGGPAFEGLVETLLHAADEDALDELLEKAQRSTHSTGR